jgi:hypothetical protein
VLLLRCWQRIEATRKPRSARRLRSWPAISKYFFAMELSASSLLLDAREIKDLGSCSSKAHGEIFKQFVAGLLPQGT